MEHLPKYVGSIDIETKGVDANAFILSIGAAMFETSTLRLMDRVEYIIDPSDASQRNRSVSHRTMQWWAMAGKGPQYPTMEARNITWGGTSNLPHALKMLDEFVGGFVTDRGSARIAMKGPDFDFVILRNALDENGWGRASITPSMLDSARTVENLRRALQLPRPDCSHLADRTPYKKLIEHTALSDALTEGYEAAFMYQRLGQLSKELAV